MIKRIVALSVVSILSLAACTTDTSTITQTSTDGTVTTVSSTTPKLEVKTLNNPTDGEILVSPFIHGNNSTGNLLVLDKDGKVIKSKKTAAESLNFQKWNIDGLTRYSYIEHDPNAHAITNTFSNIPGSVVILDNDLNEVKRIRLLPFNNRTETDPSEIDAHDFILLNDNHYIVMTYYPKTVNNIPENLSTDKSGIVLAAVIQEVENDKVIWEWDSTNYPELYSSSVEGNDYNNKTIQNDYAHINSFFIDPKDGNLICSFRNLSQIIKINHTTGDIMWRLGGKNSDYPLTDEQKFYFQHNATLVDNNDTLLFLDNGSATERANSRILEFKLDESNKRVSSFNSFSPSETIFSQYMGSVQKRGDTYFIGWGSVPRVSEINYKTGETTFDMNLEMNSYRAFKY